MSVEAAIIFPLLLWAFGAMFVFFDAYKDQTLALKGTYSVADMISRQDDDIDGDFVKGLNDAFAMLVDPWGRTEGNDIRVSVVRNVAAPDEDDRIELQWSCGTGSMIRHEDADAIKDRLPLIARGDELAVIETTMDWTPPFRVGLLSASARNHLVFIKPRYVSRLLLDANGNGNGIC